MWKELIKKIELQSILVLLITILFGYLLLIKDNSWTTPAGILGSILIAFGVLYTFGAFFSNQIKESYKDVILEYKSAFGIVKSANNLLLKNQQDTLSDSKQKKKIGGYIADESNQSETQGI